jgi:hypothetical protein
MGMSLRLCLVLLAAAALGVILHIRTTWQNTPSPLQVHFEEERRQAARRATRERDPA